MKHSTRNAGVRYAGGKGKVAKGIVPIVNSLIPAGGTFWDPFCGSGKILQSVRADHRIGSDIDRDIITLLRSVRGGWDPPTSVTEAEYKTWMGRRGDRKYDLDPMRGFVLFGCSFGARYGQGYARSKKGTVNFAASARTALLRQKPYLDDVTLIVGDYRDVWDDLNMYHCPHPIVVYRDIPYFGTKPVGSLLKPFDHKAFWDWAKEVAQTCTVLISEYTCPIPTATILWEKDVASGIRFGTKGDGGAKGDGRRKSEKLYALSPNTGRSVGLGLL